MSGNLNSFMNAMRAHESAGNGGYSAINSFGYIGGYQMGEQHLRDIGWIENDGILDNNYQNYVWSTKSGIVSTIEFFEQPEAQDKAFISSLMVHWERVRNRDHEHYADQVLNGVLLTLSGMVAASHNPGTGRLRDFINSGGTDIEEDANGYSIVNSLQEFAGYDLSDTSGIDATWLSPGFSTYFVTHHQWGADLEGGTGNDVLYGYGGGPSLGGEVRDDTFAGGSGGVDYLYGGSDVTARGDAVIYGTAFDNLTISFIHYDESSSDAVFQVTAEGYNWREYINDMETIVMSGDFTVDGDAAADALSFEGVLIRQDETSGGSPDGVPTQRARIDFSGIENAIRVNLEIEEFGRPGTEHAAHIKGFNDVMGGSGGDTITGDENANILNGGGGADELYGGAGNDVIVFDADDTAVQGGEGRDVGIILGDAGMTVDLDAMGLEAVTGGGGADTFVLGGSGETRMAAGGAGDDRFIIDYSANAGPRIVWGGDGADQFNFVAENEHVAQVGIVVAHVSGLTELNFADLTFDMLGLGGIDLAKIAAIIVNPDAGDRFTQVVGGAVSTMTSEDYEGSNDEYLYFGTMQSNYLGATRPIQAYYVSEPATEIEVHLEITSDEFENVLRTYYWTPFEEDERIFEIDDESQREASEYIESFQLSYIDPGIPPDDVPDSNWFVTGGGFHGASLSSDGSVSATMPPDTGASLTGWLFVA